MEEERKIVKLTLEHVDKVYQYMKEEFVPDEPVMNAFGFLQGTDFWGKMFDKDIKKELVDNPIKSGHSFGVFDEEGNILGIKLGKILTKENFQKPISMNWVLRFPDALVPKTWRSMTYATKFFEWMEYTEDLTIGQCEGNNGKIYEGLVLGVAKRGRRQGLGDKLVKHALNHAREEGCSHAHTLVSGIFSQKIMKNNGFEIILEKNYDDFKDKQGNILIHHEIHKTAQINVLKL